MFTLCVACGSAPVGFSELGSANEELQKCYEKLPVSFCNSEANSHGIVGKTSVVPKSACEDMRLAVRLTCKTQFAERKLETMAQITRFDAECTQYYKPQIEKVCGKDTEQKSTGHQHEDGHEHAEVSSR